MKVLSLILVLVATSTAVFADEPMTEREKKEFMAEVAKEFRKDYWQRGFEQVSSRTMAYAKADIDNYVKEESNRRYHEPLDGDEIADLYRCHYEPRCEVYLIRISGSYYSGWGEYSHFVLLNVEDPGYDSFSHLVYGE